MPTATPLDRSAVLDRFRRMRARTRALFDLLDPAAYYERPIQLRNPVVFYEGHLPAFAVNTLIKKGLGQPGIDEHLETIFARGIDPEAEADAVARGNPAWPNRGEVLAYVAEADRVLAQAITAAELDRADHPLLAGAQALWTILEHEEMHQETLAYIWHQAPYAWKRKPEHYVTVPPSLREAPKPTRIRIPAGTVTLGTTLLGPAEAGPYEGADAFGWDNELPAHEVDVDAFEIDTHDVTNAQFLEFVDAGGYRDERWWTADDRVWLREANVTHPPFWERADDRWFWKAMFERVPLPPTWPVYVTWAEAQAFATWRNARLMSEAEFHRAAYGTPDGRERRYPWGDSMPYRAPGNFDFLRWDPEAIGTRPEGMSAFGVHDLVGNGWEWTSDVFAPFAGFAPMPSYPEYSAEFFDDAHYVMKGASPMTARALTRRGFRNWFRPRYPYVYATFRCVRSA
jgi:ergothioneine biosynthesis protein EgtB